MMKKTLSEVIRWRFWGFCMLNVMSQLHKSLRVEFMCILDTTFVANRTLYSRRIAIYRSHKSEALFRIRFDFYATLERWLSGLNEKKCFLSLTVSWIKHFINVNADESRNLLRSSSRFYLCAAKSFRHVTSGLNFIEQKRWRRRAWTFKLTALRRRQIYNVIWRAFEDEAQKVMPRAMDSTKRSATVKRCWNASRNGERNSEREAFFFRPK